MVVKDSGKKRVLFVAGTRPEIIKMVPVVQQAKKELDEVSWLLTGQNQTFPYTQKTTLVQCSC